MKSPLDYRYAAVKESAEVPGMQALPQTTVSEKFPADFCWKCGAKEVRPVQGRLFYKFLALQPHACLLCSARYIRFQFSVFALVTVFMIGALTGAIRYFSLNPISFSRDSIAARNTAEALARARIGAGEVSSFEELMMRKSRNSMDNAAILRLSKARVSTDVILKMVQTSLPDYDISADDIIELKKQGVDESVILAMIDATYSAR